MTIGGRTAAVATGRRGASPPFPQRLAARGAHDEYDQARELEQEWRGVDDRPWENPVAEPERPAMLEPE